MFKIKRPAIVGLLLILLIFTGYLNYELTQQALRKTSKDYKKHEELEMAKHNKEDHYALEEDDFEIVDSVESTDEDIAEVVSTGNKTIEEAIGQEVATTRNYFVEYRLSRDKLRANLVDRLDGIVRNENTNDKMRTEAQQEIMNIGKTSEVELQIEGLIKSKGFDDALVFLTNDNIKVVVSSDKLSEQDMVKILDIVKSETDYDVNNIKITKK